MNKTFLKRHHILLIVLALAGAFSLAGIIEQRRLAVTASAQLWFFDVGQGDAVLIRDREGKDVLIDGGPGADVLEGLSDAMPFWDRTIDVVLVTHLDADHYVGLFGVLQKYKIGEIWWNGAAPTTDTARRFVAAVEAKGIAQRFVQAGERADLADGTSFQVLWPREEMRGRIVPPATSSAKGGGTNDFGIVGTFSCGASRALFTGDISAHVEAALLDDASALRAELLKVAHHGSAYSTSEAFLDAVRPKEAVISSGAGNRYGHPTPRVLSALLERGISIHRTDREGTIRYACAGGRLHLAK
ncbi:MAG: MBL fold metallo-hydrolase [Patescibacteria group bacterium]|nr:MAG: MBL fold metallo-hydrolase [Patescibacteria group bacterium]